MTRPRSLWFCDCKVVCKELPLRLNTAAEEKLFGNLLGVETVKKLIFLLLAAMLLTACGPTTRNDQEAVYVNITAEEAKEIMGSEEDYVILNVQTQEEYDQGHIPSAVLIPNTEIEARAEEELPDNGQLILVYCRSGNRSKKAAEILVELGYTNIKEFGGIIDWPYEVE